MGSTNLSLLTGINLHKDISYDSKHEIILEECKWFYIKSKLYPKLDALLKRNNMILDIGKPYFKIAAEEINLVFSIQSEILVKCIEELKHFFDESLSNLHIIRNSVNIDKSIDLDEVQRRCTGERIAIRIMNDELQVIGPGEETKQTAQRCMSLVNKSFLTERENNNNSIIQNIPPVSNVSSSISENNLYTYNSSHFSSSVFSSPNLNESHSCNNFGQDDLITNCDMCKYIQLGNDTNIKNKDHCRHVFCKIHASLFFGKLLIKCPLCSLSHYYENYIFKQPRDGIMQVQFDNSNKYIGLENNSEGLIIIHYSFSESLQESDMFAPKQHYEDYRLTAYLPHSPEGLLVLQLLRKCFNQRKMFLINEYGQFELDGVFHFLSFETIFEQKSNENFLQRIVNDLSIKGIT